MAKSWATRKVNDSSFVNKYLLDTNNLSSYTFDLDIQWLMFIAYNRKVIQNKELYEFLNGKFYDYGNYDIIIGPTADDKMFDTLSLFFENNITVEHCLQALNTMDLDIQYNIKTEKSINALVFNKAIELDIMDKEYYSNEIKMKKEIMNEKMKFVRRKYGNIGKYFDEITDSDLNGILEYGM